MFNTQHKKKKEKIYLEEPKNARKNQTKTKISQYLKGQNKIDSNTAKKLLKTLQEIRPLLEPEDYYDIKQEIYTKIEKKYKPVSKTNLKNNHTKSNHIYSKNTTNKANNKLKKENINTFNDKIINNYTNKYANTSTTKTKTTILEENDKKDSEKETTKDKIKRESNKRKPENKEEKESLLEKYQKTKEKFDILKKAGLFKLSGFILLAILLLFAVAKSGFTNTSGSNFFMIIILLIVVFAMGKGGEEKELFD